MRAIGVSVALALGAIAVVSPVKQVAAQGSGSAANQEATDLTGTYWASEFHPKLLPMDGGRPPLNAAGEAAYAKNQAGLRDHSLDDPVRTYCLPDDIPRLLATPYPFELFQLPPGQVTFVHELNNQVRVVPLDVPLPDMKNATDDPTWEGYQTGHYEEQGAVLVIQARGFNDQTFLDYSGLPHSDRLETTEHIRRMGNRLEDVILIHDPTYYTKDWKARFVYERRSDLRIQEYICGQPHRDISGVKGIPEIRAARAKGLFP